MKYIPVSIVSLFFFLAVFAGCGDKPVIPEDTLIKVYADLVIVRDTATSPGISKKELDMLVFKKYNVTRKDYESSIKSINANPEQWEQFFDKAILHLETLQKKK